MRNCSIENFKAHRQFTLTKQVAGDVKADALIVKVSINLSALLNTESEHYVKSWTAF